jgi:C-terminal peptidase (prc)
MRIVFISLLCTSLIIATPPAPSNADQRMYEWSETFAKVLQLANQKHYNFDNIDVAMAQAINAFLSNLDPHSSYLDRNTYESMMQSTSGEFFGIGIVIDNTRKPKDKFLLVVDTIPEGPADKAGLKPLDKLVEIDGNSLEGMTTEEATAKLKGQRHSKVHVKVLREEQSDIISFDIIRDVVKEQNSMSFYIKNHNIYYISLSMFSENAVKQIEKLLKQASSKPYKGLILDLRNNSGGLLTAAIDIAGLFMEKGSVVVTTKDKHDKVIETYRTRKNPIANINMPIFILINNYTASAAEILAAALKNHSNTQSEKSPNCQKSLVILVGTTSFGKGSVQEVIPIGNNSAAKITTSLYFPSNMNIQGAGIEPDIVIQKTFPPAKQMIWFMENYGQEKMLPNSIKTTAKDQKSSPIKKATESKSTSRNERIKEMLEKDNQLRDTITLINILNSFNELSPQKVCNRAQSITQLKQCYINQDKLEIEEIKL